MTNNMKESMVASNYRKNKCFMKCKYHRHADKLCEGYNEWEFEPKRLHGQPVDAAPFQTGPPRSGKAQMESELRICPEKNRICQVECWSQEDRGWNTPLYSYQQLTSKPLGINLTEAMLKNYRYYRNHGNSNPHDPKLATESATKELLGPEPIPGFWLPVCDSDEGYQQIVDFDKQHHSPLMIWNARFSRNLNKRSFPISCGGYRSDATEEFFEAIGMNGYKADFPHRMNRFFKNYAPRQIATLIRPPLDNFLAMCNIGIQYPQGDTQDVWNGEMDIRREPSQFCVPVEEETRGMSQLEANLYFCAKSKHARELFKHQGPNERILGLRRVKNHMMLCEEWYRQERIRHSRVYTDEEWKAAHDLAGLRSDPEYWKDARGVDKAGMPSKKGNRFFQNNFHDMWHPSWDYPHPVWKATKRLTKVYRPINAHHAPIGKQLYRYWTKERAKARMGREIERGRKKGERLERLERKKNLEEVPPEK